MNEEQVALLKHVESLNTARDQWDVSMPSRGIGDTIAKFTHATGIAQAVHAVSTAVGVPCGCGQRQENLNQAIPFNKG